MDDIVKVTIEITEQKHGMLNERWMNDSDLKEGSELWTDSEHTALMHTTRETAASAVI